MKTNFSKKIRMITTLCVGLIFTLSFSNLVLAQHDWANPIDRIDYPNLDIGHYPLV